MNVGRSKGNSEPNPSWNYLYGLTLDDIAHMGIRADLHYSRFNSPFARGNYKSLAFSRQVTDALRLQLEGGQQNFGSAFTSQSRARFANANLDWAFVRHYFLGGGLTVYRGQAQSYNQIFFTLGYRF